MANPDSHVAFKVLNIDIYLLLLQNEIFYAQNESSISKRSKGNQHMSPKKFKINDPSPSI